MLALVPLGSELERIMGSVRMFYITILLATSNAILHLLIALLVAHIPFYRLQNVMDECAIGFSGVIFSLIVIETSLSGAQSRSVFGLFNIPAKWYPLILLVLFQVLMTNVSLLGHLCGILSGFAYTYGFFNLLMPGTSFYSAIESSSLLPTQDSRFPGRGRTLSSSQSPVHVDSNLQARLLDNSSPENRSHMIVTETGDRLSDERQPALGTAVAVDRVPAGQQGAVVSDEEIQKLVSMGFDKTQVEVALAAADGDLNVAVEILSQQG
ncbi:Rhomboid-like protein 15 [Citrus sinensis]|uniref:Rhomboid-like protein 15 n=1 Tax=Citrus sinensis TaxID=2711 RepID=A0ACB8K1A1_CITSI|nr:Rhomboid-like protein 15 [Citrus sinensis]